MPTISIRSYQPGDREAVLNIAADTAFFGEPVEYFMEDRHLFNDAFYRYYTDIEPEHGWVLCVEGNVVGFLMGATNSHIHHRRLLSNILPTLLSRIARGYYRIGSKTINYSMRLIWAYLCGEHTSVNLNDFPAHLHINILPTYRGHGLGKKLMKTFIQQLQQENIPGVHLITTNRNIIACRMYESLGFKLLDSRITHLWKNWIDGLVENRCYGLKLYG
jgi:ribosomal protein S18 acetylase RimI-like enzyme